MGALPTVWLGRLVVTVLGHNSMVASLISDHRVVE